METNKPIQDDHTWYEALSGKTDEGQGARLRRTLREIELADAAQEDTTHDWQRLQFALRREAAQKRKSGSALRYFALAASLLIFVSIFNILKPISGTSPRPDEGQVTMRGMAEQVIYSENPLQEAKQLEADLVPLGVKVSQRSTADKITLRITVSYPVKNEVRVLLEARNILVPEQGDLNIVFLKFTQ